MLTDLDKYTSTGIKFWKHPEQLEAYAAERPQTVISTHIAPEGACNLDCSYCSVHSRKTQRLSLDACKQYLSTLRAHGLKALILTGGGEPTAYKDFNPLVRYANALGLKVGLITNGTLSDRVDCWDLFDWVRVSINIFPGWQDKITIPKLTCTVGASFIYCGEGDPDAIAAVANSFGAEYIRVLPDCTKADLTAGHAAINAVFDDRFMHQPKVHRTPRTATCHQSYFRPYLHESGFVYPCDSVVLNNPNGTFQRRYELCRMEAISDYLAHRIKHQFDPREDCHGCVFTNNIDLLDEWVTTRQYGECGIVEHEDFV